MREAPVTAQLVRSKYRSGVKSFIRLLGDPTLRLNVSQEIDAYFRRCALAVWQQSGPVTQRHVEAYNALCSEEQSAPAALYFELCSAVAAAAPFAPPPFFHDLVRLDAASGRNCAQQFTQLCSLLLLMLCAVDGAVSPEERAYVDRCCAALSAHSGQTPPPGSDCSVTRSPARETAGTQTDSQSPQETSAAERPDPEALLQELDALCGLDRVKEDVRSLINLVKVRKLREEAGLPVPPMSLHLVFLGNPGTGKTTVARLLAKLYHAIGVLSKGQLVEVDRSGLVAGFVGQTAIKTQEAVNAALGGVLFIDEAYSLTNQEGANDFGGEAVEILLKNMEDHRDDLIVIVAGYQDLMEDFIHSNPGLESRFNKYFYFEDYNAEQLLSILESQCLRSGYALSEDARDKCRELLADRYENRDENFGNARYVRNLFERLIACQADRVAAMEAPSKDDLMCITGTDYEAARLEDPSPDEDAAL